MPRGWPAHNHNSRSGLWEACMKRRDLLALGAACCFPLAGVAQQSATTPPAPSACQQRLTPDHVIMHPLPSILGPGSCGAEDVVRLDAVVLNDGKRIALALPLLPSAARYTLSSRAPHTSAGVATVTRTPRSVSTATRTHSICAGSHSPTARRSTSPTSQLLRSSASL